ncbi:AT-rich interactive domain-containing protein 4B isoform X1 [Diorhabda sublineata]|uniref:AT-rich interactive domain-containing protein 4B isoform X1 n=1 Tax=Diorhabda sublineata TaxID=1163346 RepID=UPI0024E13361|nr:AT-rich interactive domain-containing protein 4B isoform X1 [Diorhabda sublineata]
MQVDDPPYLSVGTAVSAKYKGAFCEAKVSKVVRLVKCKVTYKMGLGTATLTDEQIKGTLRVGQTVQAKYQDKKELVEATITKIQDCSQYTVVFDDGDITTLRRTALCLKSGRHFNESETLDQLPLTHPEHFGNPVVGGRRGRRNRQLKEDSSEGEVEEENEPDLEAYMLDIKRVVSVETTEKKRSRDSWFPGLVVIPSAQPTVRINMKDEYLIRSFKDGRYYTVPKKEVSDFNRELAEKVDSPVLVEAINKAIQFLDHNELPPHWEKSSLFHSHSVDSESDENYTDSSDDEPNEEKDRFVAQLYKFMDEAGTPLNKTPTISNHDIDLHRLFRIVEKMGGYNRVCNQNKWRTVSLRLRLPGNQSTFNQVKAVYKKCLSSYETFYRTLGVTMLNHTRPTKKNKGRSLIRDRDRTTPINSPAPEKEELPIEEKKEMATKETFQEKVKRVEKKRLPPSAEVSDTNSSDTTEQVDVIKEISKVKREKQENKVLPVKDKKGKQLTEKIKPVVEKIEEQIKKEEEKVQNTRSKAQSKPKETVTSVVETTKTEKKPETKIPKDNKILTVKTAKKCITPLVPSDEEKKRGKKRIADEKPVTAEKQISEVPPTYNINVGDKLKVFYGSSNESKTTYEAKVIEIDKDQSGQIYLVHYTGWNTRYDEWIQYQRIAENLSATKKTKRSKQNTAQLSGSSKSPVSKPGTKRTRVTSTSARSSTAEPPRSTTPSSVTSSGSRTKSPATPATRSTARLRRDSLRRTRRISAQTDISTHTESESEGTGSDSEVSKTRNSTKSDNEVKTYRRRPPRPPVQLPKTDKRKDRDDEDLSREEQDQKPSRSSRRIKRSPEKSAEESEDENNPKGRDFDLNQIRSELKGFTKALKLSNLDADDEKEVLCSSSDESNPPILDNSTHIDDEIEEKPEKPLEKSSSSEDVYEFKEPEPFEFESRAKLGDEKKRLVSRLFEEVDKNTTIRNLETEKDMHPPRRKETEFDSENEEEDEEETLIPMSPPKEEEEDPFDKLVESPSFNLIKTTERVIENKEKVARNIADDSLSLFRDLPPDASDDYSGDMELSDCESQTQIFATNPEKLSSLETGSMFGGNSFSKPSPDENLLDLEFSSLGKTDEGGASYPSDEDSIREQIQRVIAQSSSTDDDSNDGLNLLPTTSGSFNTKTTRTPSLSNVTSILGVNVCEPISKKEVEVITREESKDEIKASSISDISENDVSFVEVQHISPALQETDSALLESIVSHPPISLNVKLEETAKELSNVKTGTKIADSILQKFNSIKNETSAKVSPKSENDEKEEVKECSDEVSLNKETILSEDTRHSSEEKVTLQTVEEKVDETHITTNSGEESIENVSTLTKSQVQDVKKRKKVLSRSFIEDSETDSSDSEQLIIARSDEDSQTASVKLRADTKESDSSNMFTQLQTTDDSQSQEADFNFEAKKDDLEVSSSAIEKMESEAIKEEEPDPNLHSLLLCEEVIPRSPAPLSESSVIHETKCIKSVLEMPFASAPSTSNNKNILLDQKKSQQQQQQPVPMDVQEIREEHLENSTIVDNTPPTTPESTMSNMSPRGDVDGLSPNMGDNESCKSQDIESEYPEQRSSVTKVSPYSEEDTQMMGEMKKNIACKKRRKSLRNSEDTMPLNNKKRKKSRSRQNSDSDSSEHSNTDCNKVSYNRQNRSPRPSKYNFYVEFDHSLDSTQRIAVLQQKLAELRKTYADVKAELAAVERRRKKIRRREREAIKAAKQELACI